MKKVKTIVIILLSVIVLSAAYTFAYSLYGGEVSLNSAESLKFSLENNVTNIQCVNYSHLDDKYKSIITEDDFYREKTIDEYLVLFNKVNSVESSVNFYQSLSAASTDNGKHYPCEVITDGSGNEYLVYHHIYVASSLFFEPVIVQWTVDITENK